MLALHKPLLKTKKLSSPAYALCDLQAQEAVTALKVQLATKDLQLSELGSSLARLHAELHAALVPEEEEEQAEEAEDGGQPEEGDGEDEEGKGQEQKRAVGEGASSSKAPEEQAQKAGSGGGGQRQMLSFGQLIAEARRLREACHELEAQAEELEEDRDAAHEVRKRNFTLTVKCKACVRACFGVHESSICCGASRFSKQD